MLRHRNKKGRGVLHLVTPFSCRGLGKGHTFATFNEKMYNMKSKNLGTALLVIFGMCVRPAAAAIAGVAVGELPTVVLAKVATGAFPNDERAKTTTGPFRRAPQRVVIPAIYIDEELVFESAASTSINYEIVSEDGESPHVGLLLPARRRAAFRAYLLA
ncbi:MAG: hypothetical protein IJ729_04960 [Alloprevotella sp.]|nr:hypothetical protein [Alloprevotella sp.]